MTTLIINADDFGYNEGRTRAILECFEERLISNTTLMVNMPFADEAVELARRAGVVNQVGLHLNLTEGRPLTDNIRKNPLFCDADGFFNANFHRSMRKRVLLSMVEQLGVAEEIDAQLRRYCSLGLTQLHLDSHHHSHTDFSVFRILAPLAAQYGFRTMRLSANLRPGGLGLMKGVYKTLFNAKLRKRFGSVDSFGQIGEANALWPSVDGRSLELMVHPLHCQDGTGDDSDTHGEYETRAGDVRTFLSAHSGDFRLVSYGEL